LSLLGSVLDVNVDSVEVREQVKEQMPGESEEENEKPCLMASEVQLEEDSSDGGYS